MMNIVISISIRRKKQVPQNIPLVKSISTIARRVPGSVLRPFSSYASISHLSITQVITAAGMNARSERSNMLCRPTANRSSITSHRKRGGLSA